MRGIFIEGDKRTVKGDNSLFVWGPIPYRHCATLRSLYSQNCSKLAHIPSIEKGEWRASENRAILHHVRSRQKSDMGVITSFVMIAL